jgi:hypothetical protein
MLSTHQTMDSRGRGLERVSSSWENLFHLEVFKMSHTCCTDIHQSDNVLYLNGEFCLNICFIYLEERLQVTLSKFIAIGN